MQLYIYLSFGLLFLFFEIRFIIKKRTTLRKLSETNTEDIEFISSKEQDSHFECEGRPIPQDTSPVTHTPCTWWSFLISELKVGQKGNTFSVPVVMNSSEFSWLFLESAQHILALTILDLEAAERINTFSWTSVLGVEPPPRLQAYLNSRKFGEETLKIHFAHSINPSVATSYLESIVPAGQMIHVHGQIKALKDEEKTVIEEKLKSLNILKPLLPLTIGGPHYHISLKDESATVKKLKFELWMHVYLLLFGIVIVIGYLSSYNFT
jgi:hypothetical protein